MLSQILYTQVELRSFVLRALKILVDSNVAIASQDPTLLEKLPSAVRADTISQEQAAKNVDFLRGQVDSWLAVLFNVFGSVDQEARRMVGEVITAWLGVAGDTVRHTLVLIQELTHTLAGHHQRVPQSIGPLYAEHEKSTAWPWFNRHRGRYLDDTGYPRFHFTSSLTPRYVRAV